MENAMSDKLTLGEVLDALQALDALQKYQKKHPLTQLRHLKDSLYKERKFNRNQKKKLVGHTADELKLSGLKKLARIETNLAIIDKQYKSVTRQLSIHFNQIRRLETRYYRLCGCTW